MSEDLALRAVVLADVGPNLVVVLVLLMAGVTIGILLTRLVTRLTDRFSHAVLVRRMASVTLAMVGVGLTDTLTGDLRQPRYERARDVIVLASVDMWTDAISAFDDVLRIRFYYRNTVDREVEAFGAHFQVRDTNGCVLIDDHLAIDNPVGPKKSTSWTEKYWATCEQTFTLAEWDRLTHCDIADLDVEWHADGLVFADGEAIR